MYVYASPIANMNCPSANRYQAQAASGLLRRVPQTMAIEQDRPTPGTTNPLPATGGTKA